MTHHMPSTGRPFVECDEVHHAAQLVAANDRSAWRRDVLRALSVAAERVWHAWSVLVVGFQLFVLPMSTRAA